MVYFVYKFRVQVLIYALVLLVSNTKGRAKEGQDNLIADFLQKFIKPFLRSANLVKPRSDNVTVPMYIETKITKLIRRKVKELKPVLQDDDEMIESEDNLTLHGNEETTLIEFLPKTTRRNKDGSDQQIMFKAVKPDPLKISINKYKVLREQIKAMLDEEKITERTKTLILTTLDEMIAQLIESQCNWIPDGKLVQSRNDTSDSISKLQSMTKKQWKKLRHQYMDYLTSRKEKENTFMSQFHQFFSSVINDTYNLGDRFKIRCQLVQIQNDRKATNRPLLREQKAVEKNKCENFKLCSDELKAYFIDFYNYVNDTAVSVFKNYASMYVRDVNIDFGIDKNVVVGVLNSLGNMAERKVIKIYKHELQRFKLDPDKNKNANVKVIKNFIKDVVMLVKQILKHNLIKELGAMKTKLFMTVKEDLSVNLEVDMENLERHYIDTICTTFVLCNGRYSTRRTGEPWTFRPKANNEVFVKVQLSLDDEMKEAVARSGLMQYLKNPNHVKYRLSNSKRNMRAESVNIANVSVTRTSLSTTNVTLTTRAVSSTATESIVNDKEIAKLISPTSVVLQNTTQMFSGFNLTNEIKIIAT